MSEEVEHRIRELERIEVDLSAAVKEKDSRISQLERAAAELQSSRKAADSFALDRPALPVPDDSLLGDVDVEDFVAGGTTDADHFTGRHRAER